MIDLQRNYQSAPTEEVRIKIVGLGGAGSNALDRIVLDGVPGAALVAINTDVQALTGSVATEKVQLGRSTTRGLGAGGDPEVGYTAAEEGIDEIRAALEGAQMLFLCVGLGGGTGSGAAPLVASLAREQNALVVVFATMPFTFEGRRRAAQAEQALSGLRQTADVVICFDNDKMGEVVSPRAGIHEAFALADQTISQSVRAIAGLVSQVGLMRIGFDELTTALRAHHARCVFGFGEAEGDNRAHEALARALKNPLMDRGRMLEEARNVLVNVTGGPDMTLNEVQILMDELGRHISDETRILFGTAVDPRHARKMMVTIISSIGTEAPAQALPAPRKTVRTEPPPLPQPLLGQAETNEAATGGEAEEHAAANEVAYARDEDAAMGESKPTVIRGNFSNSAGAAAPDAAKPTGREGKQEQMQFEPVTRGRFEKSEPTIVDGQDLDVPTFLRRNVKVK